MVITKTNKDLKPVLMNPKSKGVKEPYFLIEGQQQTVFVVAPGLNGEEFNKTIGYFNNFPSVSVYQVAIGAGILIMQRNDDSGGAKEFKFVSLNPGRQVNVPTGWGVVFINTGKNFLVLVRNSTIEEKYLDSKPITTKHGLAYYAIDKKGDISFERNPSYRVHPQITTE